jgi:hypothetical protein
MSEQETVETARGAFIFPVEFDVTRMSENAGAEDT